MNGLFQDEAPLGTRTHVDASNKYIQRPICVDLKLGTPFLRIFSDLPMISPLSYFRLFPMWLKA